jgi:hypothetical protein
MHFRITKQAKGYLKMQHDKITRVLWGAMLTILGLFTLLSLIGHLSDHGLDEAHLESFIKSGLIGWGLFALYMLPAIVALARFHHNSASIFLVNFFLGWTFLGWVAALVWAVMPVQHNPSAATLGLEAVARELAQ